MAIDPNIKQKAADIRTKVFGSEVRESLASGLEGMSEDVESIKGRQGNVESQFQNVIDETTDKDVISAPELIAARNGKSNLKTRLDDEHAQVTAQLQQTEQELNSRLSQVETHTKIKMDKTIFIGDSYGNFPTPESSWIPNTANLLGIPNGKWYRESEGGAGFTGADGSLYTFKQLLERLENTITDKVNVGQIIVCGGFNDRGQDGTVTRITAKIGELMTYVKATYPNATVYIGMIGWSTLSGHANQLSAVLPAYTRAGNYGAKYLNNVQYVMHNRNLFYDDVHPNLEGAYRLADAISSAIKTGSASVNYETKQFARGYDGAIGLAATTGNFFGTLNNNISTLRIQRGRIAITATDIDLTGGTFHKILSINNGYFTGTDTDTAEGVTFNNNVFGVGTPCKIGKTETDGIDVYAVFYVYDGYLCAKFYRPAGGASVGATRIDIPDLIITGDTMTA